MAILLALWCGALFANKLSLLFLRLLMNSKYVIMSYILCPEVEALYSCKSVHRSAGVQTTFTNALPLRNFWTVVDAVTFELTVEKTNQTGIIGSRSGSGISRCSHTHESINLAKETTLSHLRRSQTEAFTSAIMCSETRTTLWSAVAWISLLMESLNWVTVIVKYFAHDVGSFPFSVLFFAVP